MMIFQAASADRYEEILRLYEQVICQLEKDGICIYWDLDTYPSRAYFARAIEQGELYIALEEGVVVAAAVLDHHARPEYVQVPWQVQANEKEALIMHVLGVSPNARGRGVARFMLESMKQLCRERGLRALRLDALTCNAPACALYRRAGLTPVARRMFCIPDVGDEDFEVFEYVTKND